MAPCAALLLLLAPCPARALTRPPNILLFISDDHGLEDYGFAGHPFARTPNIDLLAQEGVVFTNGYASASVCMPSLQTLLAGIHPQVWTKMSADLRLLHGEIEPRSESRFIDFTLPRVLRTAGYTSFAGGKMWEGSFADAGFDDGTMRVNASGFEIGGANTFGRPSLEALYSWVDEQEGPWFAWVAPKLPHQPHDPPDDWIALYEGVPISDEAKRYFGNVSRLDRRLGDVIDYLESRQLANDTVVIYLADNGWVQRLDGPTPEGNLLGDDDGKASIHDRGFHTPIIVRWPGGVKPGTVSKELVTFEDTYATILDYAGVVLPSCARGQSFRRLADDGRGRWRRRHVYAELEVLRVPFAELSDGEIPFRVERARLLRTRRWAYNHFLDRGPRAHGEESLFDMKLDPLGRNDVATDHPRVARRLRHQAGRASARLAARACPIQ